MPRHILQHRYPFCLSASSCVLQSDVGGSQHSDVGSWTLDVRMPVRLRESETTPTTGRHGAWNCSITCHETACNIRQHPHLSRVFFFPSRFFLFFFRHGMLGCQIAMNRVFLVNGPVASSAPWEMMLLLPFSEILPLRDIV